MTLTNVVAPNGSNIRPIYLFILGIHRIKNETKRWIHNVCREKIGASIKCITQSKLLLNKKINCHMKIN